MRLRRSASSPSFGTAEACYIRMMTRDQVKAILDRVLTWPPERQADVAHVVEMMEEQDKSDLLEYLLSL